MAFSTVPEELVDYILQYFKYDKKTSYACSLVCHAWLRPSRRNLFERISFNFNQYDCSNFLALARKSPEAVSFIRTIAWSLEYNATSNIPSDSQLVSALIRCFLSLSEAQGTIYTATIDLTGRDAEYVLELLEHAPGIAAYIRAIQWSWGVTSSMWGSAALSLASKLSQADTLVLEQTRAYLSNPTIPTDTLARLFPTDYVTELSLSGITFHSGTQFLRFVHAFAALETLVCENSKWEETLGDREPCLLGAPPLRHIAFNHFSHCAQKVTLQWLLTQCNPLQLETIVAPGEMSSAFNDLLRRSAPTIRFLDFSGEWIDFIYVTYSISYLRTCKQPQPRLHSISVHALL
jgi:hypothetical protein